ncbi:MAG: type IV pilus assembly protein PilM, partial [Acidobacteria bacterium]|nr:type IV pilus assembly protein PilM [Acidobacteriota bacterium]
MFKWRARKKKSLVGLDVGTASVKAVELAHASGGVKLLSLASEPLMPDTIVDGQVIEAGLVTGAVAKIFEEHQIKTGRIATAVGGYSTILKNIVVPLMTDEEWAESYDWHAEEHIPFDMEDVLLDTQIVERSDSNSSQIALIAACKKVVVENRKQPIEAAGKQVAIVDCATLALENCYVFNYEPEETHAALLLHVGAATTVMNIMTGRRSNFSRDTLFGAELYTQHLQRELSLSFEQAEEAKRSKGQEIGIQGAEIEGVVEALSKALSLEALIDTVSQVLELEIRKTLDFYRATSDEPASVQKILISGGGSKLNGLIEYLSNKLELPVEPLDPFRRIKYDERRFSRELVGESAPEMAIAVGLALRGVDSAAQLTINLLNDVEKRWQAKSTNELSKGERRYRFKGRNRNGDLVIGTRVADSREQLNRILRSEGITPHSMRAKLRALFAFNPRRRRERVSLKELERFTRFFAFMMESGLPIIQSLQILSEDTKNDFFRQTLDRIVTDVEDGSILTTAFGRHPKVFDRRYVSLIEAGETGGMLDIVLKRLLTSLEQTVEWRRKVKLSLLYPLTAFALLLLIALVAFTNRRAGLSTTIFAPVGAFLTGIGGAITGAAVLASLSLLFIYYKSDGGRRRIDGLLLRAPVFGEFLRRKSLARFARMLGTLLSNGCPILQSIHNCAEAE